MEVAMTSEYFSTLEKFVDKCIEMAQNGQPYLVILACHELYRFLYPVEPYADFEHTEPVSMVTGLVKGLLEFLEQGSRVVVPYSFSPVSVSVELNEPLESRAAMLYSQLWEGFDENAMIQESKDLLLRRLPEDIIAECVKDASILDMGCGSGRYSIALYHMGAAKVTGVDAKESSYSKGKEICENLGLPIEFKTENFLNLSFENETFDFVFCNGTIHHSTSIRKALSEIYRVLNQKGKSFLYVYADGGIFWETRKAVRRVFKHIPLDYTQQMLKMIGMPGHRFIFCDTWYTPVETHTTKEDLQQMLTKQGFEFEKVVSNNKFDLDNALFSGVPGAKEFWGDGEHRYILRKVVGNENKQEVK
jgi:ubiquinone/menaquinone biosynthesis C-methylase UbiE